MPKTVVQIVAGKIAFKKDVCESYGFYESGKTHIWRSRLRDIREKEGDTLLFKGNWLSPKEVNLLIKYLGEPANFVKAVS